jgi:hypothetical protein
VSQSYCCQILISCRGIGANVGACDGRGLGGLSNGAKRNAKADQLYRVPRDNAHKDNGSYEDTEPPPGTSIVLWPVTVSRFLFQLIRCPFEKIQDCLS